jgi:hypothetical protein
MGWEHYESETIFTKPEWIFEIWSKVEEWHKWDVDIQSSSLQDKQMGFINNSKGTILMKNGQTYEFCLKEVINNQRFSYTVNIPLCEMEFTFEMNKNGPQDAGTVDANAIKLTHGAKFNGLVGFIMGVGVLKDLRNMTVNGLAHAVKTIKNMTEEQRE